MTTNYHTPFIDDTTEYKAAHHNAPLSELDTELTAQDARLTELESDTIFPVEVRLPSGAAMPAFVGAGDDGWEQQSSKDFMLRWNNSGTPTPFVALFLLPEDLDASEDIVVHILGSPTSTNDSPVFTIEAYFSVSGTAPGADADCGGESSEFTADTDLEDQTLTIANADIPAGAQALTLVFHPKDGELPTDDFLAMPPWLAIVRS